MSELVDKMRDEKTCTQAAASIREIVTTDRAARRIVESELPEMIHHSEGKVRFNAVDLAGDLKIDQAIPDLIDMLKDPKTEGGPLSFGAEATLRDDPPGHALASIGAPAIPSVKALLDDANRDLRIRAILVLANMHLRDADLALEDAIPTEKNQDIKKFIDKRLKRNRSESTSK